MKRIIFAIVIAVSLNFIINAQEQEQKVAVNHEMINRFNECQAEGEYLSWRDLVLGFENQTIQELYLAYRNADLDKESLNDIKLALENKLKEHHNNSNITEQDLAWYNQIKREINNKMVLSEATALR